MVTQANGGVPRVLVVDDEAMLADLLAQALRHEGWETATAKDGLMRWRRRRASTRTS